MTNRSYNSPPPFTLSREITSAIGGDGKYETYSDGTRLKWNNYSRVDYKYNRFPGSGGATFLCDVTVAPWPINQDLQTLNKLLHKVKGHSFNLGVSIAEGTKTVGMVKDNMYSIALAARDLKHGNFQSALRRFGSQFDANTTHFIGRNPLRRREVPHFPKKLTSKDLAGRWLEARYGWEPLISDVYSAMDAYHALTSSPRRLLVKASSTVKGRSDLSVSPSLYNAYSDWSSRVYYRYELTENIPKHRSLGLTDPTTIVWELIPYSFVIDWFIPIGTYLENLSAFPSLTGRSLKTTVTKQQGALIIPKDSRYTGATYSGISNNLDRVVTTGKLANAASPHFVGLPKAMSPLHIVNGIALMRQLFR